MSDYFIMYFIDTRFTLKLVKWYTDRIMKKVITTLSFLISAFVTTPVYATVIDTSKCIDTAVGCINGNANDLFKYLFGFGTGIAGGIAFLLIIYGGFTMVTSAGNPEKLNEGKELVGSAIAGLLLIIFSVFLLKFIGFNVLCIPGFGGC